MKWPPHITVATVVEDQGRFLFVEELSDQGMVLNQPAGHLEPCETLVQAALRETLEESCWEVDIKALVGIYIYHAAANQTIYHRYCFSAQPLRLRDDLTRDSDISGTCWLTLKELSEYSVPTRSPLVRTCLDDYLAGKRYPLELIREHG
ncbi:NUDIX hydrolase [Aestuariirhabdus sp. LZHN29]|uniref:NUDIX hydrolase n=1 Tax=Aestuariirhabdus sp. LZHN29 TaxID=3417462 RepID=UPI003CF3E460